MIFGLATKVLLYFLTPAATSVAPPALGRRVSTVISEVEFLHQRDETRILAERIENTVGLQIHHPLGLVGAGLFEQVHRTVEIAKTEIDYREIEWGHIALHGLFLKLFDRRQAHVCDRLRRP